MSRIPALGRRGEGWVAAQIVLILLVAVLGALHLPGADPGPGGLGVTVIGIGLAVTGGILVLRGVRGLGPSLSPMPRPIEGGTLVRDGAYARIRHPIYTGLIGLALGWSCITLSLPALAASLVLVVVLDLKARLEEAWLAGRYPDYAAYARETRRFLPGVY